MSAIFLWLILNVLLVTAVLQNSMSSVSATQIVKMAWYDNMRFKQWTVTKFLVAGISCSREGINNNHSPVVKKCI